MIHYTISEMAQACGVSLPSTAVALSDTVITAVSTDSRSITEGSVYFALRGERFDGADFVSGAFKNGASVAVVNEDSISPALAGLPVLPVKDTVLALGAAAKDYRSKYQGFVFGVTGTNGKTTAKEMMRSVISSSQSVHATDGNFNNHIGLPLTVFGLETSHDCAVIEMGMSAAGEIAYLGSIAQPDVGVILNVGPAHMEFFESIEAVADAKMEMLEAIEPGGAAIINGDDPLLKPAFERFTGAIRTFGLGEGCEFRAENIETDENGCASFTVDSVEIALSIPGRHNVYNALAAFAAGRISGIDDKAIASALASFSAPDKRMEVLEKQGVKYINDSYNANPMSMMSSLNVLKSMVAVSGGRKIAALGTMLELGEGSDKAHRSIGKAFGEAGIAMICCVGDMADSYRAGALQAGMNEADIHCFDDSEAAADFLNSERRESDIILVKGSRGIRMELLLRD